MENGCLTPTLKPRRFAIEARYRDAIDTMYDNGKYEIYDNV
jgi:long-subunit acyl-CoA synthetase (AMP-forming)